MVVDRSMVFLGMGVSSWISFFMGWVQRRGVTRVVGGGVLRLAAGVVKFRARLSA